MGIKSNDRAIFVDLRDPAYPVEDAPKLPPWK
jgi:hypothetical protein